MAAVTLSFYLNGKWTFSSRMTLTKYAIMVIFMASLSWATGEIADAAKLSPLITLITFSGLSLFIGYFFSKYFVFRDAK